MTIDADKCQSGLNLASQGALAKLGARQLGRLIGIHMLSSSDQLLIMERVAGLGCLPVLYGLHKGTVEGRSVCDESL